MTASRHPVTGLLLNELPVIRTGPISEEERQTAALLLAEGIPRWVVSAKLGRHPLAFNRTGRKPEQAHQVHGGKLSTRAARADKRQASWDELLASPDEDSADKIGE